MADFSKDQGGIQSSTSTQAAPLESGVPTTGFVESPTNESECCNFGVGPGVGANTRKIH